MRMKTLIQSNGARVPMITHLAIERKMTFSYLLLAAMHDARYVVLINDWPLCHSC